MGKTVWSVKEVQSALKALERRAKGILQTRPAYKEMVTFYLTIFRRQIEWRDRLTVHPEKIETAQAGICLSEGIPLAEHFDPGIDSESLLNLWSEMKTVFHQGNPVLKQAINIIDEAEKNGELAPLLLLLEQRPDRSDLVEDASHQMGIEVSVLASLARAVTFPHWQLVAENWLQSNGLKGWRRFRCPVCGGLPGLVETRSSRANKDGALTAAARYAHCPFCGSRWAVPALLCPSCESTKPGDAKYLFTSDEPELRIDFCKSCHHYVKVVDGDKISGQIHIGLELLTTAHLDFLAQEKKLSPLEVCA